MMHENDAQHRLHENDAHHSMANPSYLQLMTYYFDTQATNESTNE
jgi:hypothetical protein